MNLLRYCYTVLCVLLFAGAAEAAGGVITGDLRFFQAQENYCPNSRNCVGSMYTQSDFNVYAPIADIKIYLEDASDHGGTLDWWVDYVLDDIATGRRERDGRIK